MKSVFNLIFKTRLDISYKDTDELFVSNRLKYMLNNGDYAILDDLLIPSGGNTTMAQIDHVVVSIYGIFCIETKSHKGWIFGSEKSKNWTQVIYRKKYPIHNPLHQNYGHIKAIELALGKKLHSPINSLVAFPSADKIHVTDTDSVGDTAHIIDTILSKDKKEYTYAECIEIINLLRETNMASEVKHVEHVNEVRQLLSV